MEGQVRELSTNPLDRAQRFVVLALDEISLIVAQQEIQALEPVLDVQPNPPTASGPKSAKAAGVLLLNARTCNVYALDSDLTCLSAIPEKHRICAIMNHREAPYALSCKEVRLLPRAALTLRDIPKPLQIAAEIGPVKWLVINDDQLLLGTTANALFAHVSRSLEAEIIPFDERSRRARK